MQTIPNTYRDLLDGPVYAVLTTLMPDGSPQSTIVWANYNGQYVKVNTAQGRQKDKNMRADPRVSLLVMDPQNPYRWLEIRGRVAEITPQGGVEHIEELSQLYMGKPFYGGYASAERRNKEVRLVVKIEPLKVNTYGD